MKTKSHFCVCVFIILLHYSLLTHSKFKNWMFWKEHIFIFLDSSSSLVNYLKPKFKWSNLEWWGKIPNCCFCFCCCCNHYFSMTTDCTWRRPWPSTIIPFGSSLREVSEKWKLQVFRMRWTKCWILRKMLNFWPFKMGNFGNFGTVLLDQNCQKSPILASKLPKLP